MALTPDEVRDVLARAEEIQEAARHGDAWNAEVQALIGAAEEVGLSRESVERALAERIDLPAGPPAVGSRAWAQSADGKFYVADVMSVSGGNVRVRFLHGGDHEVTLDKVRPCAFIPGERIGCHWPMWGPWVCTVIAYDAERQRVKLSDGWGSTKTFRVSDVWLAPRKNDSKTDRKRVYARVLLVGAAVGAALGSIITALVMR